MERLFMTFIFYSFIGWLWETLYCSIKARHLVYRGFLLGPYCPVYGIGVSAVLLLVPDHSVTLLNLYLNAVVIVTIVEYITSWLLEKLFHMKLWDYTNVPLNIEGRVAVPVSFFWGIGCVVLLRVINPIVQEGIRRFMLDTHSVGALLLFLLFVLDVGSTILFTATTKKEIEATLDHSDVENAALKEFRLKHLISNRPSSASRKKILQHIKNGPMKLKHRSLNRLLKNYPNMRFKK